MINHSADIDCNDFMRIYREFTREPYSFLTIDTTLPATDPLRFRKKPCVFEKAKFDYLGMTLINSAISKRNKKKVYNKNKQDQSLVYNSPHGFTNFKDIDDFNKLSLASMHKKLNDFKKRFNKLKTVNPQIKIKSESQKF